MLFINALSAVGKVRSYNSEDFRIQRFKKERNFLEFKGEDTMKKEPYYEIKFWKDWLEADYLDRLKLVGKLPFFKMCLKMKNNKMWKSAFSSLLNGYFEDLACAAYTKASTEKTRK